MDTLKFKRDELLTAIKANREGHRQAFDDAIVGYEAEAKELLSAFLEKLKAGKRPAVHISLPLPQAHTKDYDRIIRMIEMSIENEIELAEHEFGQYVQDDWSWKAQFLTSNSHYMATGAALKSRQ